MSVAAMWFELYVKDMARAKTFYESLFEVSLESLSHNNMPAGMEYYAFPKGNENHYGCSGALVKMPGCEPVAGPASCIVYFSAPDVAVMAQKAVSLGASLHCDKTPIGEFGYMALVADTEGNMIGFHSM